MALWDRVFTLTRCGPRSWLGILFCLLAITQLRGAAYRVDWDVIASGGGESSGGTYSVSDTIGQPETETMSGGTYSVISGYWSLEACALPAPTVVVSPASQLAQAGDLVEFTAMTDGPAPLGYQWVCNGVDLVDHAGVTGAASWQVTLAGVTRTQAGEYQVRLTGWFGSVTSAVATLTVNSPPVAQPNTLATRLDRSAQASAARLLANDYDEDGDTLRLTGVSPRSVAGGTVTLTNDVVTYTPSTGFLGDDSFTYTITDGRGGVATATVAVTVATGDPLAPNISVVGNAVTVQFAGVPGLAYRIERSAEVNGPWSAAHATNAPPAGLFSYLDTAPLSPSGYYRLVRDD